MNPKTLATLATLLFPFLAAAPSAKAETAEGGVPAAVTALQCLVGEWTGTGTMQSGGQTFETEFTYSCQESSGGMGVTCHFRMTGIPNFTYEMDDLWGYDPHTGKVHWFTVTNAGETHDHAGRLKESGFLARYVGRRDGKPMRENIKFQFSGKEHFAFSSVVFVNHERVEHFTGTMNKKGTEGSHAQARR